MPGMLQSLVQVAKSLIMTMPAEAGEIVHTAFPYEVWVTTPSNEMEIGGRANDWLSDQHIGINMDYIFNWRTVPGSRDHYRFAFSLKSHADRFEDEWRAYLVSRNN